MLHFGLVFESFAQLNLFSLAAGAKSPRRDQYTLIYKYQNQPDDLSRSALQYVCIFKCVRMWQPATTLHTAGGPAAASCPSREYS